MAYLRLGTKEDITAIISIVKEVVTHMNTVDGNFQWDKSYPLESDFTADVIDKTLWVACSIESDEIIGFAALTQDTPIEYHKLNWSINEPAIVPHRVAVSMKHRHLGVGQLLLRKAEEIAMELNFKYIRVDTNEINVKMRGLFEKLEYMYIGSISLDACEGLLFSCYEKIVRSS